MKGNEEILASVSTPYSSIVSSVSQKLATALKGDDFSKVVNYTFQIVVSLHCFTLKLSITSMLNEPQFGT
jgi:hypothetical protein